MMSCRHGAQAGSRLLVCGAICAGATMLAPSGFGHPSCKGGTNADNIIQNLSKEFPAGPHKP